MGAPVKVSQHVHKQYSDRAMGPETPFEMCLERSEAEATNVLHPGVYLAIVCRPLARPFGCGEKRFNLTAAPDCLEVLETRLLFRGQGETPDDDRRHHGRFGDSVPLDRAEECLLSIPAHYVGRCAGSQGSYVDQRRGESVEDRYRH